MIATKVGAEVFGGRGLSPARITSSVEGSLKRLRTDYIDLYFAHYDDPSTPLAATLEAFDALVRAGKVRAIGASNYGAARLAQAAGRQMVAQGRGGARILDALGDHRQPQVVTEVEDGLDQHVFFLLGGHGDGIFVQIAMRADLVRAKLALEAS
mgnify:CR=1 FL=1